MLAGNYSSCPVKDMFMLSITYAFLVGTYTAYILPRAFQIFKHLIFSCNIIVIMAFTFLGWLVLSAIGIGIYGICTFYPSSER